MNNLSNQKNQVSDNKPTLRFSEFTGEWERKKLGEVCENIMYGMNSAAIPFDGKNKYLRITDIDEDSREFIPKPLVSPDGEIEEKYKLKYGDIVFTRTGASVGKTYLYNTKDGNLLFAGFLIKFSIVSGNPYFIFSQTLKENYNKWVLKMSMRSGQPGLNAEECKELDISYPNLSEQTKIAEFFTAIDAKIQALKTKKEKLQQYKKGVMQQLFTPSELGLEGLEDDRMEEEKNPTILKSKKSKFRQDDGKEFPNWEMKKLGEVAKRKTLKNKEGNTNVLTISAQYGLISQLEFFNKSVSAKDVTGYYLLENGDFAYNKSYSNGYPMGAIKSLNRYEKGVVSTLYICFKFNGEINNSFMEHFFETGIHNSEIEKVAQEGARNHGLLNIGLEDFFNIELSVPSLPEQTKIANFLSSIDEKINHTETQIQQTQGWKKGLLQKMFV